ncbi:MAG: heavy-metal-associated domain-containing protein [Thiobacillus sp.]|nr:heavy-metal-associated domain-containing protein [Thiobacillus sp.]
MHQFIVDGMGCHSCVRKIERAVQIEDPNARVDADLKSKQISVSSSMMGEEIAEIIVALGYPTRIGA